MQTVKDYWNALAAGDLDGAYGYLDPAAAQPRQSWKALRQKDGLYSVSFGSIDATQVSDTDATVAVDDLVTDQTSCRTQHWSGWYHLVKRDGAWLIHNHKLNKPGC